MAVRYIFARASCAWLEIEDPAFVFTSPNMDQGTNAGARSHIVPGEVDVALWLEDSTTGKMYRCMIDISTIEYCYNGQYGYFNTIDYDNYKLDVYTVSKNLSPVEDVIYLKEYPKFDPCEVYLYDSFSGNILDLNKWVTCPGTKDGCPVSSEDHFFMEGDRLRIEPYTSGAYIESLNSLFYSYFTVEVKIATLGGDGSSYVSLHIDNSDTDRSSYVVSIHSNTIYVSSLEIPLVDKDNITVRFERNYDTLGVYIAQGNYEPVKIYTYTNVNNTNSYSYVRVGSTASEGGYPVATWCYYCVVTECLNVLYTNASSPVNNFYVEDFTPHISNRYLLNDNDTTYNDSVGSVILSGSNVDNVYNTEIGDYVVSYNGTGIITSNEVIYIEDSFSISMFVTSSGYTCSGNTDVLGECQTIVSIVDDDSHYMTIGLTEDNKVYYRIETDDGLYGTDTGIVLSDSTFNHIGMTVSSGTGIKLYLDGNIVSSTDTGNTIASGTLSIGNVTIGTGSRFYGSISDVILVSSGILPDGDMLRIYEERPFMSFNDCAVYGIPKDNYSVNADDEIYYDFPTYKQDLYPSNALHVIAKLGEAYNCYLTAWDDNTHYTITNVVFTKNLLKLSAALYRSFNGDANGFPTGGVNDVSQTYPVYSPVSDYPVKGDEVIYGKFNFVYYSGITNHIGDILVFRPRLSSVTQSDFPPGNYSFVLTFHYQYT